VSAIKRRGDMKKRMLNFLELVCFSMGAFLIFYIIGAWVNFAVNPQLCLIIGAVLVGAGFVIQLSHKKS